MMKLHKNGVDREGKAVIEMGIDKYITVEEAVFELLSSCDAITFNKVKAKAIKRSELGK